MSKFVDDEAGVSGAEGSDSEVEIEHTLAETDKLLQFVVADDAPVVRDKKPTALDRAEAKLAKEERSRQKIKAETTRRMKKDNQAKISSRRQQEEDDESSFVASEGEEGDDDDDEASDEEAEGEEEEEDEEEAEKNKYACVCRCARVGVADG